MDLEYSRVLDSDKTVEEIFEVRLYDDTSIRAIVHLVVYKDGHITVDPLSTDLELGRKK